MTILVRYFFEAMVYLWKIDRPAISGSGEQTQLLSRRDRDTPGDY
jgi:hypothetical protein